jgi:hypothetical protein
LLNFLCVSTNIGQKQKQIKTVLKIFTLAVLYILWVSQPLQSSPVVNWIFLYVWVTTVTCRSPAVWPLWSVAHWFIVIPTRWTLFISQQGEIMKRNIDNLSGWDIQLCAWIDKQIYHQSQLYIQIVPFIIQNLLHVVVSSCFPLYFYAGAWWWLYVNAKTCSIFLDNKR